MAETKPKLNDQDKTYSKLQKGRATGDFIE